MYEHAIMSDRTRPRKQPRQERSRFLFDVLVRATQDVVEAHGYERATTNQIAERAGVSVGSLYQYFPGKEALAGEVLEQRMSDDVEVFRAAIGELVQLPLEGMLRAFVLGTFRLHREQKALYTALVDQVGTTGRSDEQVETMMALTGLLQQLLLHYQLRQHNVEDVAFFVVHGLLGIFHGALRMRPELIEDDNAVELASDWLIRWLVPDTDA